MWEEWLHKPTASPFPVHVRIHIHALPSPAPEVSSVLLLERAAERAALLTSDFSVHVDTPQLHNRSQFKHILKAKILTWCPFLCLFASVINDSAYRQGCDTDNLTVASFSQMPRYGDVLLGYSLQISEICY